MDKLTDRADRAGKWRSAAGSIGIAGAAILMVGVVTFGATNVRPMTADSRADASEPASPPLAAGNGALADGSTHDGPTDGQKEGPASVPDVMDGQEGDEHPWQEPKEEPTEQPTEPPSEKPAPVQEPKHEEPAPTKKPEATKPPQEAGPLALEAWAKEGRIKLAWSKYDGDGFEYYKVVRSPDAAASWPLGENDELVAVVSDQFSPWYADNAPCGHEWHYRVFAVRHAEEGYKVLAESNQAAAAVECADGPVEPKALGFELHQVDAGVKLDWEACTSGDFVAYKVVRSQVNENPTFPLNDGTQLVAVFENHEVTTFTDTDLAAGQTWIYRVYSMAKNGDGGWVVLGLTQAKTITVA